MPLLVEVPKEHTDNRFWNTRKNCHFPSKFHCVSIFATFQADFVCKFANDCEPHQRSFARKTQVKSLQIKNLSPVQELLAGRLLNCPQMIHSFSRFCAALLTSIALLPSMAGARDANRQIGRNTSRVARARMRRNAVRDHHRRSRIPRRVAPGARGAWRRCHRRISRDRRDRGDRSLRRPEHACRLRIDSSGFDKCDRGCECCGCGTDSQLVRECHQDFRARYRRQTRAGTEEDRNSPLWVRRNSATSNQVA